MSPLRLHKLQKYLLVQDIAGIVITKRENIAYLTGLTQLHPNAREAILLITPKNTLLFHSPFIAPPEHPWLKTQPMSRQNNARHIYQAFFQAASTIAVEAHSMTVAEKNKLQTALPQTFLMDTTDLIEKQRLIKTGPELIYITQAAHITDKVMSYAMQKITQPTSLKISEQDFAHLLESKGYRLGADSLAFPPVVAFGKNSALPHHQPSNHKLTKNSVVLIDIGFCKAGYHADMTRTICLGTPPPRFSQIETIVKLAHQAALNHLSQAFSLTLATNNSAKKIKPLKKSPVIGPTAATLDQAVREVIAQEGFGDQFIHTTGHGVGLDIHEAPSINSQNNDTLQKGMAITIEPGIYLEGEFGFRHEDTVILS